MSTEMTARCYVCHLTRYVNRALALGDEETATAFARDLMELYRKEVQKSEEAALEDFVATTRLLASRV